MVFSILVILLVGLVAYFHYIQGFFSATISAILCVFAAVFAVAYYEPLTRVMLRGKMADQATALTLCIIFAVVYSVLRLLFDKAIPGNVRTPSTVDKVGAGLMGLVAGTFAIGIFAIAVESLPFGPTISFTQGSRLPYDSADRAVLIPGVGGQNLEDAKVHDMLTVDTMDPDQQVKLWLPADDIVVNTVYRLSEGTLSGERTLSSIHPDYLLELFGQRLGMQPGTRHSALEIGANDSVTFVGARQVTDNVPTVDGMPRADKANASDSAQLRPVGYKMQYKDGLQPAGNLVPVIIRLGVTPSSTDDTDHLFRFSPGAVRLVVNRADQNKPPKDYFMVGTMEGPNKCVINRPDDFLFVEAGNENAGFDAVFMVDKDALVGGKEGTTVFAPNTFIEVKRLARINLSDKPVGTQMPAEPAVNAKVLRSKALVEQLANGVPEDADKGKSAKKRK